jgi:hypothetical protein
MGNGFFDTFMRYVVDRDRDAHKFTIANAAKDLHYVNNLASDARMMNIIGSAVRQCYAHVEAIGRADDYAPMLSDHVAALNGVDIKAWFAMARIETRPKLISGKIDKATKSANASDHARILTNPVWENGL